MSLFEVSVRAPLLVSVPGTGSNQECPRPVEFVDLYPTLVEACGLPMPQGLEGRSLVPLLKNPGARWDKPALSYIRRGKVMGVSVRTERYRYTEWDEGRQGTELYDHQNDPTESLNLASEARFAPLVAKLKPLLRT
jgi:uncharacterized sulfatase